MMKKTICIVLMLQMIFGMMCVIPASAEGEANTVYYTDIFEGEAVYLIEDPFKDSNGQVPDEKARPSGWDIDYRGGSLVKATSGIMMYDIKDTESISMTRKVLPHKEGKITFETCFNVLAEAKSDFVIELRGQQKAAVRFVTENNKLYYTYSNGKKTLISEYEPNSDYTLKVVLNFDSKKTEVYAQGKYKGEFAFSDDCKVLEEVYIETPKNDTMDVNIKFVNMYINYLVNERFLTSVQNTVPDSWKLEALSEDSSYVERVNSKSNSDLYSFKIVDENVIDKAIMRSSFDPQTKKVAGEVKMMISPRAENLSFSLNSGDENAIRISTRRNKFLTTNNQVVYEKYLDDFWYTFKIIADVEKQTADIYLNYKIVLEDVPFENKVSFIDNVSIETGVAQKAQAYFDDVLVYEKVDKPKDYVPEPKPVESKDHNLAMMMYSMWREGNHYGWDRISPFSEERKPYLGYYGEGNTETADWEIKWLVEHGFDYQVYCWCRQQNNLNQPVKVTSRITALHDGYMSAEYSDKMKFALLFSFIYKDTIGGIDDFKKNVVPYWIEYYFKDPRYMVIDNKPVVYIYTWNNVDTVFGGVEGIKEALNYASEEVKKLGFDGINFIGDVSGGYGEWDKVGTQVYNYCWKDRSVSLDGMKDSLSVQFSSKDYDVVPSIAMGWDNEPWVTGVTGDFAAPETVGELSRFVQDKFDEVEKDGRKPTRNVIYTCWNEWGEGHFYAPSNAHGFDYLNEIRNAFTDEGYKTDEEVPTERALARLQVMYPPNREALKILNEPIKMPDEDDVYVLKGWYFDNPEDFKEWTIYKEIDYIKNEDGKLIGHSIDDDPRIANENIAIDLSNVVGIRSNLWVDGGGLAMFIYRTDSDPVYGQGKRFDVKLTGYGYTDYFAAPLDASKCKGTMTGLFFDPDDYLWKDFGDFGLKYIEILALKEPRVNYYLDGVHINPICQPEKVDDVAFMSGYRSLEAVGADTNWDNGTKTFTIKKDGKTIVMKDGSSIALVNGTEKDMGAASYHKNGHFMVPIDYTCKELGINVTHEKEVKEEKVKENEYEWQFDDEGNLEGWTTANVGYKLVKDNEVMLKCTTNDPLFKSPELSLDATKHKYIKIRMKNFTGKTTAQMFFITDSDKTWGGGKNVDAFVTETKDYVEYTFDMSSNAKWEGKITQIRFDPTSTPGTVYVDYVKILSELE